MRKKGAGLLILILAVGALIGNVIGRILSDYVPLLAMSQKIGLTSPVELDLNYIYLSFGLLIDLNLAGLIGLILAIWIFRNM